MTGEEQIREIVAEVTRRLVQRLGPSGGRGDLVVVFSAATVEFEEAAQQVRDLILAGFRIRLAFSGAAEHLLAGAVREQLRGFPHVSRVEPPSWFSSLKDSRAVVVPMLSLNTLSKLSMLIADSMATNIILHGLLMGKPVVAARNGADPGDRGREELGFHKGNGALRQAMAERLRTAAHFGCVLADVRKLAETVQSVLAGEKTPESAETAPPFPAPGLNISKRFVTAADVRRARRAGAALNVGSASGMTPLAKELAKRYGVVFSEGQETAPLNRKGDSNADR